MIGWLMSLPVFFSVVLNEIYPNPEGNPEVDEWVEIYNSSENPVSLKGWQLSDAVGTVVVYTFPDISIAGNEYLVIQKDESKITLNNSGDGLRLVGLDGYMNIATFGAIAEKNSWAKMQSGWEEATNPTKGFANYTVSESITPTQANIEIKIKNAFGCPENDDNEWVELENKSSETVSLTNWTIRTEAGRTKPINDTIKGNDTQNVEWESGFLSNEGTKIFLINETGIEVDSMEVSPCAKNTPTNKPPSPTPTLKPTSTVKPDPSPSEIKSAITYVKEITKYPTSKQASVAGIMEEEIIATESGLPPVVLPATVGQSPKSSVGGWLLVLGFGVMLFGAIDIKKHLYV
jgi:hypothetical protein